jgi:hypothetical protein
MLLEGSSLGMDGNARFRLPRWLMKERAVSGDPRPFILGCRAAGAPLTGKSQALLLAARWHWDFNLWIT